MFVHTGKLKQLYITTATCWQNSKQLYPTWQQLTTLLESTNELSRLYALQMQLQRQLYQLQAYLQDAYRGYETSEQQLLKHAEKLMKKAPIPTRRSSGSYTRQKQWYTTHRTHTTLGGERSLTSYMENGVCAGIFASLDVYRFQAGIHKRFAQAGTTLSLGHAQASADVKALLYENDTWNPQLRAQVTASAALAKIQAGIHAGSSFLNGDVEASLGVGVVKGEGKIAISKEEVTIKGEVGVAALQGEVKGKLSLFGMDITVSGIGEVGSAGIGAEFSSKKGEVEFGGKASLLAGLGFKVKINYG